jgi:hypothetical protein
MSSKFSSTKLKLYLIILVPIMFAVHAVNFISYLWYMDIVTKCFNAIKR